MDYLPIFAELKDRPVLVVGGGVVAARKIALLRRAHARILLVARELHEQVQELVDQLEIQWLDSDFHAEQLDHVFLVIAATNDHQLNQHIYETAQQRHRLVNVVDDQPHCSFIFPSIVDRHPLIVAISSGGKAPVLARIWREKLEALLPTHLGQMAEIAGKLRLKLKQQLNTPEARRRFWDRALRGHFASLIAFGKEEEASQALADEITSAQVLRGEVILVDAGTGDVPSMTLGGLQALQQADVVLHDDSVTTDMLDLRRREAESVEVSFKPTSRSTAKVTSSQLVETAIAGKTVVLLQAHQSLYENGTLELLAQVQNAGISSRFLAGVGQDHTQPYTALPKIVGASS